MPLAKVMSTVGISEREPQDFRLKWGTFSLGMADTSATMIRGTETNVGDVDFIILREFDGQ